MKKWISIGVIILIIVGGSFWFYHSKKIAAPQEERSITSTVQKGDINVQVSGSGSISSINSSDITSTSEGIIDEVLVEEKEIVKKGDELATFTDGSDPITAPHAGTITSLDIEDGSRVQSTQVVGHITDYKTLQSVISVDELDITSIKEGQTAELAVDAFPDETFTGTVTKVAAEGTANNGVSSFDVTVQIKDPKELLIGMSSEVKITTESKKDVLYVPIEAVQIDRDQKYVNVQEATSSNNTDAETTKQVVETGINDDQNIEIVSGLTEGQTIQLPLSISSGNQRENQGFPGGDRGQGFPSGGGGQVFPSGGAPGGSGGQGFPGGSGRGGQ
ncbi:HlyD family efflux transporter periplasmic adaptor subunit [Lederbergia sp. NSJ-179]|uniref:HlyD family efflux transporter periplasmic adaptor subunit n=1 Tax=Lederbergia sp. NSJ-179 TaxID=2931402 RepID=UPI001FD48BF9|nr:HlyD family efflux transporter periplasmic adaptor subunit [Lederbergia sp. NSJ-179]MCJ7841636.1 HlyD family efflux transporter periplasmic adaptor subunit [Lederbergia sp. NSJ-179]